MQLLSGCQVGGTYEYMALGRKQERVTIHNEDELYARLPVGAASLEGKLARFGALHVDMTIVGRKQATRHVFERAELNGRCDDATHVLTGLTLGAFSLVTGASLDADASASFGGTAAGGEMTRRSELLASDGDPTQCDATTMLGTQIPDCSAVLRVEAIPLAAPQPSSAPAAMQRPSPPPVVAPPPRNKDKSEALARKKRAAREKQERRRQKTEKEKAMDPVERERQRQRRFAAAWRGVGIGASMLTGGSLGLMAAGAALLTQYSNDARDPDFVESASDRTRRETGTRRLSLGIAGTLGFGALAATAFGMSWRLRHDVPPITASVSRQFTGLSISGRF